MVSSDGDPMLSIVWEPDSIFCFLGSHSLDSTRLMVSQLTSTHETMSQPVLVSEARTLAPVSQPPCEVVTIRLAHLDPGDHCDHTYQLSHVTPRLLRPE